MLKNLIIIICFNLAVSKVSAQSINYSQLQKVFTTWMNSKGKTTTGIATQLKAISPKWKLMSLEPLTDGDSKYYVWTALDTKTDTSAVAMYIEEDETTVKYSLRYAYHSKVLYNSMVESLKASSYYAKGRITSFTDKSKNEVTLNGFPDETLPIAQRIDLLLSSYELNNSAAHPPLYTVDIYSRYIPKH